MKRKKLYYRILGVITAAALLLLAAPDLRGVAMAEITQGDIDDIRDELDAVARRKRETEERLIALRGDLSQAQEQVNLIQEQVVLTEQQIDSSRQLLAQYDLAIQEKEEEIAGLEAQEAEQYQQFYAQVRWMEETGSASYVSVLFRASSFSEFLDYAMLVGDIMAYSDRIIAALEATQAELDEARAELQADRDAQASTQAALEAYRAELVQKRAEATALLNGIAASESEYAELAAQLAAEEAELEEELAEAERLYAEQLREIERRNAMSGEWYWPVPGYFTITSMFGGRYHPITGIWESHTGTDIGVPRGVEIHAAKAGVVTVSTYNISYGNYCIVNHGGGYMTLYAHMLQLPSVSVGQTVEKGQVLGYIGMTGSANGYHLHFELRINGVRSNVLALYPHLKFIDAT